jgi:nucleoside-diphosphate-sugar epimerase
MSKNSIITVLGGSGYVGKRCIDLILKNYPDVKVNSISRNIKSNLNVFDKRVRYLKGDCLNPETFKNVLTESTGVIHTIGQLLPEDIKGESYYKTNYETCVRVAELLNENTKDVNFVYISAERGLAFPMSLLFSGYIESKRKAEKRLLELNNIRPVILRPGIIEDPSERPWLMPIALGANVFNKIEKSVLNNVVPNIGDKLNLPARTIYLNTVCLYAIAGAMGKLDKTVYTNDYMNDIDNMNILKL